MEIPASAGITAGREHRPSLVIARSEATRRSMDGRCGYERSVPGLPRPFGARNDGVVALVCVAHAPSSGGEPGLRQHRTDRAAGAGAGSRRGMARKRIGGCLVALMDRAAPRRAWVSIEPILNSPGHHSEAGGLRPGTDGEGSAEGEDPADTFAGERSRATSEASAIRQKTVSGRRDCSALGVQSAPSDPRASPSPAASAVPGG